MARCICRAAPSTARPACTCAPRWGSPTRDSRVTGLHWWRRSRCADRQRPGRRMTSMFILIYVHVGERSSRATHAPASWHTRSTARSSSKTRDASTVEVARAAPERVDAATATVSEEGFRGVRPGLRRSNARDAASTWENAHRVSTCCWRGSPPVTNPA